MWQARGVNVNKVTLPSHWNLGPGYAVFTGKTDVKVWNVARSRGDGASLAGHGGSDGRTPCPGAMID